MLKRTMGSHEGGMGTSIPKIMVFQPTFEEMKDFSKYIQHMESCGANKAGLAKIIPPPEWKPREKPYDADDISDMIIEAPISQVVDGKQGLYQQYNIQKRSVSVKEFKRMAESRTFKTPDFFDYDDLERKYWKNVAYNPPIYGADVPGTLYDRDIDEFNINHLNSILDMVNESYGIKIMGVNTSYLYFGMWKTTFAWHTEDMDLYSINYLHHGAPKSWYAIPPEHGKRLERLAAGFFPSSHKMCSAFLRHKMTLISPAILKQYSIPYNKITQEPGEFMITFPFAYHAGYNHGFNMAESTNFAIPRWVEYGKRALRCQCRSDSVKISMECFVKKFQPEKYDVWLEGKDVGPHPEDPTHVAAAPAPSEYELAVLSKVNTNKSKRHPPFKTEAESSGTEEYDSSEGDSQKLCTPTKGAKKSFEIKNRVSKDAIFVKASPPSFKDAVQNLCNRSKKRKRSSTDIPPHIASHSYAKLTDKESLPSCTQPTSAIPIFHWPSLSLPNGFQYDVSQLLNKLKESGIQIIPVNQDSNSANVEAAASQESQLKSTLPPPPPPPPLHPMNNQKTQPSSLIPQQPSSSRVNNLPPPPPLRPQQNSFNFASSSLPSSSTYVQQSRFNLINSPIKTEFSSPDTNSKQQINFFDSQPYSSSMINNNNNYSDDFNSSSFEMSDNSYPSISQTSNTSEDSSSKYEDQTTNKNGFETESNNVDHIMEMKCEILNSTVKTEACTSTEDLPLHNIIVNSTNVQSCVNELELMINSCSNNNQVKDILKRIPVPSYLYQFLPYNSFGEQLYNSSLSTIYPHCSICILLKRFQINADWPDAQSKIPKSSPVLIPNVAFSTKVSDPNTTLEQIESSNLIVCSDCKVCVHTVCYGVINLVDGCEKGWKCDRCKLKCKGSFCCLCPLRGGALKKTQEPNKWVHVICTLLMPGAKFMNGITKSPVDIKDIKKYNKFKEIMKCVYCQKSMADYINGYCIQCQKSTLKSACPSAFHVTCGHINGASFEANDWPNPIKVTCKKCIHNHEKNKKPMLNNEILKEEEVADGTRVVAKHKNNRYYDATISGKLEITMHHVLFTDNSSTKAIRSLDILSHECEKDGPPNMGDDVRVKWNKEILYGKYSGNHKAILYKVKFDDNTTCKLERSNLYLPGEKIPKRVEAKMSQATDMLHQDLFQRKIINPVAVQEQKMII